MKIDLPVRPRRNRATKNIRNMVREHSLQVSDLIMPLFVIDGENIRQPVESMPGIDRLTTDLVVEKCKELNTLQVPAVVLFPALDDAFKDPMAKESCLSKIGFQVMPLFSVFQTPPLAMET